MIDRRSPVPQAAAPVAPPPPKHLASYLAALPQGIDSFPDCVQKASVSREFLRFMPSTGLGTVPAPVAALIQRPPPASAWIPEVHVAALFLSVLDAHFSDEVGFIERSYVANKELLTGPLYRMLMFVASPLYLAKNVESRWNTFHRGITLVTDELPTDKHGTARFHLVYPANLLPAVLSRSYTTAFKAAIEAAGGREVNAAVVAWLPEQCQFSVSWR
jgi:hypothetical protein